MRLTLPTITNGPRTPDRYLQRDTTRVQQNAIPHLANRCEITRVVPLEHATTSENISSLLRVVKRKVALIGYNEQIFQ
jgi:hypothetical protein